MTTRALTMPVICACILLIIGLAKNVGSISFQEMYTDCKDDYTCLMYPEGCAISEDCQMISIIHKVGSKFRFRLLGVGPYYIAAGISRDMAMGEDGVVFCTEDIVGTAINSDGRNRTMLLDWTPDIENVDMKIENGKIVCSFDTAKHIAVGNLHMNLGKPLYLLLATGPRQYPPAPGVPFAGHSIKLSSNGALIFGVGRAGYKDGVGNELPRSSKAPRSSLSFSQTYYLITLHIVRFFIFK